MEHPTDTSDLLYSLCRKVREDLVDLYTGMPFHKKGQDLCLLDNGRWRFFDEQFSGACGVAAHMLTILARRHNQNLLLAGHFHHFFCQTSSGTIIDPTFEQFDRKRPIHIGMPLPWHCNSITVVGDAAKEVLRKFPDVQNPFSRYHRKPLQRWMNSL